MSLVDRALHEKLPELAVDFFVVFSRFECAMKMTETYAKGNVRGVDANWKKLADDLGVAFLAEVGVRGIAPDLISDPPKKQILLENGSLDWLDKPSVVNVRGLFCAIKDARNNLLHGGKYLDVRTGDMSVIEGSERNEALLSQSLAVLELALEKRTDIADHF